MDMDLDIKLVWHIGYRVFGYQTGIVYRVQGTWCWGKDRDYRT
jgi:hypothetical protein